MSPNNRTIVGTSIARPLIAKRLIEIANATGAELEDKVLARARELRSQSASR